MPKTRLTSLVAPVLLILGAALGLLAGTGSGQTASQPRILGWNDRGIHEMDADYGVYAMQPPGNNLRAQVVGSNGRLVTGQAGGAMVTYEAVADATGSKNASSIGKTNFWSNAKELFGTALAPDMGLSGHGMPGAANQPQPMVYAPGKRAWAVDGVPITPLDDAANHNPYPLMRLTARDASGGLLATADVVLPVSDETQCQSCHGSNTMGAARPEDGWVNDPDPERDYRLNVLRRHDDRHLGDAIYTAGLAANGYRATGLYDTVIVAEKPIRCAACHASTGFASTGRTDTSSLTRAMHNRHGSVTDPSTGKTMNAATDRTGCYRCHAGLQTQPLRGAMGHAVAADGSLAIQCQNCHGPLKDVGGKDRQAWLDLPDCQSCHTGHALKNAGELRYTTALDASGKPRQAVDPIFATNADTPSTGLALYRESKGHGGLMCAACHGTTHAEYPSRQGNDNVQPVAVQGHGGVIADCTACHDTSINGTVTGGPHTLHPIGQDWIRQHTEPAERDLQGCRSCHGADDRGTVLALALGDRKLQVFGQQVTYWQGYQVGCYNCHNGPRTERRSTNRPAEVKDATLETEIDRPVGADLQASDADGNALTLRIVSQPARGTVALAGRRATYLPERGFVGLDRFTFAAWDGSTDSNLGAVTVLVGNPSPSPSPMATASGVPPTVRPDPTSTPTARPSATATPGTPVTPGPEWRRIALPVLRRGE